MSATRFYETPEQQSMIKTRLVAKYFGAWTTLMLVRSNEPSGRIAYIDLFAGPGRFDDGKASTPLWVLNHAIKNPALCERLVTMFNDKDPKLAARLQAEIDVLPDIGNLKYKPNVTNFTIGSDLVNQLRGANLVPTLFFIDPWGYKGLSLDLIGTAIKNWGCDCIFFFNYNRINPGINNPFVDECMIDLFGPTRVAELRTTLIGQTSDQRQTTIINGLIDALREVGGKYVLPFEFKSRHGERTSHYIIFVSKEFRGYHIMKDVMAGMSTDESEVRNFEYVPTKSPQLGLLTSFGKPYSIEALKELLLRVCAGRSITVKVIYETHSIDTPYTERNFRDAIKGLEAEGKVTIDTPADKRPKRNGEVTLSEKKIVTFPS